MIMTIKARDRLVLRLSVFLFIIFTVKAFVSIPILRAGSNVSWGHDGACRMMLVVSADDDDNDDDEPKWECLGGSLALSAKQLITTGNLNAMNPSGPEVMWSKSLPATITSPTATPNASILHVVLKSKDDAQTLLQQSNSLLQQINCLGIRISVNTQEGGNQMVAPETARNCGSLLQEILDEYESVPNISLTLDLPLHLALLQANTLPKTRGKNYWQVLLPQSNTKDSSSRTSATSIAAEYLYDWDNPFGGTDPLACPTNEHRIFLLNDAQPYKAGKANVQAAAFTALQGDGGLDLACCAGLAASVASVISTDPITIYSLEAVQAVVEHYQTSTNIVHNDNGALRRSYIDFGYK